MYSLVDVVLIRALPYRQPERLVWISSVSHDRPDRPFSLPELLDYRAQATSTRIAAYASWSAIVEAPKGGDPQRLQGLRMSADGLTILGATPAAGRLFTAADDAPAAPKVVMLGYAYWHRAFEGDPAATSRTLTLNGESYTIVGVLPRFFPLPVRDIDVLVPLDPEHDPRRTARNSVNFLRAFGRLAPTTTQAVAERELLAIAARLRAQFPTEYAAKIGVRVTPFQQYLVGTQRPTLVILMACVGLMLAIALVNVVNLLLARAVTRQGEIAVRIALGASMRHVGAASLAEGTILVVTGGVLGVGLAFAGVSFAASHLAGLAPRLDEARLSGPALGLVFAVCAIATLAFSLVPHLFARTVSPGAALHGTGRSGGASRAQVRWRSRFVVAELALAVMITSATAALTQSLVALERVDLGFTPDSVFVARLSLPPQRYRAPADIARFALEMETALANEPGVASSGASSSAPLSGVLSSVPFAPAQRPPPLRRDWPSATFRSITPGYLSSLGARVLSGRVISREDDAAALPVAVVNRALAERYFRDGGAVGSQLSIDDNDAGPRSVTIVGVVDNVREVDLEGSVMPEIFVALPQIHPDGTSFVVASQFWAVRVRGDAATFAPSFRRVLRGVDGTVAMAGVSDLRHYVDVTLSPRRFSVALLAAFALIALALTTLGIYGVTAYGVEQRRREIGVRIALGATPAGIVGLVLGRTLRLACVGVALGLSGAYLAGGFMARLMFGVSTGDPALLGAVSAVLLATAMLASWVPGRRAARIDTLRALSGD
jgi:putative ABC transport system permease protein